MSSVLAIAYRKPTSGWLAPLFLVSIGLHFGAAMLAVWASHYIQDVSGGDDMGNSGTSGEAVVELIGPPNPDQTPLDTPPTDTPPTDTTPTDTTSTDMPPTDTTDADFVDLKTKAKETQKGSRNRANWSEKGAGRSEGTQGLKTSTTTGGHRPDPPYPRAARTARIQGKGEMRVTYGATGSVTTVVITRPINPLLDANTRSFVSKHWKGAPNTTKAHAVNYVLD